MKNNFLKYLCSSDHILCNIMHSHFVLIIHFDSSNENLHSYFANELGMCVCVCYAHFQMTSTLCCRLSVQTRESVVSLWRAHWFFDNFGCHRKYVKRKINRIQFNNWLPNTRDSWHAEMNGYLKRTHSHENRNAVHANSPFWLMWTRFVELWKSMELDEASKSNWCIKVIRFAPSQFKHVLIWLKLFSNIWINFDFWSVVHKWSTKKKKKRLPTIKM